MAKRTKRWKRGLIATALIVVGLAAFWLPTRGPVVSGYVAKNLCSCVFLSGRAPEEVRAADLDFSLLPLAGVEIDYEQKTVNSSLFGFGKQTAVYRPGLGCTLLAGLAADELARQPLPEYSAAPGADSVYWPLGDRLPDTLPAGVDREALESALAAAFQTVDPARISARGVVVLYRGQIVAERYAEGFDKDTPQLGWSMTKSITNALTGILVRDGLLDPAAPAPVAAWQDDDRRKITVSDLLHMSSGLDWWEFYAELSDATRMLYKREDMAAYARQQPLDTEPGTEWYYSSGTSNILSGIIRETIGDQQRYFEFPRRALFDPVGMRSAVIEPDAAGNFVGSSYAFATPRDWARFGQLYLQDGVWNGERILPEGWVAYSTTPAPASDGRYGAHFWLNASGQLPDVPRDMFLCDGFQDQKVYIVPSHEAVVVRMGLTADEEFSFNDWLASALAALPARE